MQALGRYCEYAAEIQLSFYHDDGRDEIGIVFVGPSGESVREAQRRRMVEDISNLLSRHFDQQEISEVVSHINEMFTRHWAQRGAAGEQEVVAEQPAVGGRGRRHLH
jgi:phenylpyruvate tautomerase PptA (4-oxalocrotonate tautomerase family)